MGSLVTRALGALSELAGFPSEPMAAEASLPLACSYEELILRELHQNGTVGLGELIERVAAEAMRAEQLRGAWTTDIALWGPPLFRREVAATIRRMLGRSLALEGDLDGPWLAVPVY